jgi:hypothetical protein
MLREMQEAFRAGIFGPDATAACRHIAPDRIPPDRRLAIYRSNTLISLTNSLMAAFPAVYRALGDHAFRIAAVRYIRRRPPQVPQLLAYGDGFPEFLTGFEPARPIAFLPDLARLEWARQEALFAPEAEPLAPASLQAVPAEAYPGLRFSPHPSARMVRSAFPVQTIWQAAQAPDGAAPAPAEIAGEAETVLLVRPQMALAAHRLSPGDAALVEAFAAGRSLAEAAEAAAEAEADFDLQQALLAHLTRGTFAGFDCPD